MPQTLIAQAREIYTKKLKDEIENEKRGKIIAVEVESGDYFLGDSEVEAYDEASKKYPGKKFAFLRVGARTTHFVGASQEWNCKDISKE